MDFKVLGRVWNVETIAVGNAIREIKRCASRLRYEAHGIGTHELKIKDYLD